MRIEVLDQAEADLWEGFQFYEAREPGLGAYFLASLFSDIESLHIYFGIHLKAYKHYHRLLCKWFLLPCSLPSMSAQFSSTPFWIVAVNLRGFEGD